MKRALTRTVMQNDLNRAVLRAYILALPWLLRGSRRVEIAGGRDCCHDELLIVRKR